MVAECIYIYCAVFITFTRNEIMTLGYHLKNEILNKIISFNRCFMLNVILYKRIISTFTFNKNLFMQKNFNCCNVNKGKYFGLIIISNNFVSLNTLSYKYLY